MATSITGNASNVEINNSNVWVTASDKRVIAPRGEFTNSTLSLTTVGPTGIANVAPGHTLSVGSNVYIDDSAVAANGEPTLKVHGLLEADSINFGSAGTPGSVFFADATGALTTGDGGLTFDNASNTLTSNGPVVSLQGTSLLKDTVANNTTIYAGLTVASGDTLVGTLVSNATSVTTLDAHGGFNVFGAASNLSTLTVESTTINGDLTVASANTALVGTLVANAASTTSLTVNGGLTVADGQVSLLKETTANNTNIIGTLDVSSDTTLSGALEVTGSTLVAALTANATSVTTLDAHGGFNVFGAASNVAALTATSAGIYGGFNVYGAASNVAALTANSTTIYDGLNVYAPTPVFHNNLQVNGDLIVDGNLTVLSTQNLVVDDPLILLGNTNTDSGAIVDVGMFFRQPSGTSNVVTVFDPDAGSAGQYRIAKTTNGFTDTEITSFQDIEVLVTGSFEATTNVHATTLSVASGVLINGNSIIFA